MLDRGRVKALHRIRAWQAEHAWFRTQRYRCSDTQWTHPSHLHFGVCGAADARNAATRMDWTPVSDFIVGDRDALPGVLFQLPFQWSVSAEGAVPRLQPR
ncbi:hypothetical protein, partial [Xanthomonas fragariae]|uniref:hypothetical protein n=1 Tax=Xanthomonas fragariae TaxID=48664 RepID=UPI00131F35FE